MPKKDAGAEQTGREAKARFKSLTEDALRTLTDGSSYNKGSSYYRNGYVFDPVLRGAALRARCEGQSGGPYTMTVTLVPRDAADHRPIADYDCTCPRGGFCKHIVALLLTWIHAPQTVEVREDLTARLGALSREELLVLLGRLLQHDPDLDEWVELQLPAVTKTQPPGAANTLTLNPAKIKRQVAGLFSHLSYEWGEAGSVTADLDKLTALGRSYAAAGRWADALLVFSTIVEDATPHYEEVDDSDGELFPAITDAGDGLREVLEAQSRLPAAERLGPTERLTLFRALYTLDEFAHDYGSLDWDEDVASLIGRTATPAERAQVESWVRADLGPGESGDSFHRSWVGRRKIGFLQRRMGPDLDDEALLAEYRRAGMIEELAARLLELGRTEEALAEYRRAGLYKELTARLLELGRADEALAVATERLTTPEEITRFADGLAQQGREGAGQALALVQARLTAVEASLAKAARSKKPQTIENRQHEQQIEQYLAWLEKHYSAYGPPDKALEIALRRFEAQPGEQTYTAVQQAAALRGQPPALWVETRPRLLADLEAQGLWTALIPIYLREKQMRAALDAHRAWRAQSSRPETPAWGWPNYAYILPAQNYDLQVAQAAEKDYPAEARAIYQYMAERLIEGRGRENYRAAAEHLAHARALAHQTNQDADWQTYLADLLARHKALRALKEELAAHKLT